MKKTRKEGLDLHLKIDETLISLISDYHNLTGTEIVAFFYGKMKQLSELEGNVANKNKQSVRVGKPYLNKWKKVDTVKDSWDKPYDAYAYRGFYPGTNIPFKMSGVRHGNASTNGYACFVVKIGDKDKQARFTNDMLEEIQEAVAESIILDTDAEKVLKEPYKPRVFRTMTPKGMDRLKKDALEQE